MQFKIHSFRNAETIFENDQKYNSLWQEVKNVLFSITDEEIIAVFNNINKKNKSISVPINRIIHEKLTQLNWSSECPIFKDVKDVSRNAKYPWALDFAKDTVCIEVAFNHGGAIAWNLIKPILSGELNHVEKAIQTEVGIIITATDSLKKAGNFDSAIGTYEKYLSYLDPLRNILTIPLIIVGLEAPKTFIIDSKTKKVINRI